MTTNRTNRKAEEFEQALGGERRGVDPTVAAMVAVAGALAALPQRPAPAFRESLRATLMAEAAQLAAAAIPAASIPAAAVPAAAAATPLQALAKVLAKPAMQMATGGLAATIAVAGVGVGADRSVPGDPLYGLKRAVERLQDDLAGGAVGQAESVLEHAGTRVDELLTLVERDASVARIEALIADLKAELDAVTADLLEQARAGSQAAYDRLDASVRDLTARLSALRERLPADARDDLDATMATLNSAGAMLAALPVPGTPGTPGTPTTPPLPTVPVPTTPAVPKPTTTPSPTSTTPPTPPTSAPGVPSPTIGVPSVPVTPLPTVEPTLPVTLPPLLP